MASKTEPKEISKQPRGPPIKLRSIQAPWPRVELNGLLFACGINCHPCYASVQEAVWCYVSISKASPADKLSTWQNGFVLTHPYLSVVIFLNMLMAPARQSYTGSEESVNICTNVEED